MSVRERIIVFMARHQESWYTSRQVANYVGVRFDLARRYLRELERAGVLEGK